MSQEVTPAELRELAARAEQLAADVDAVQARLRAAGDESTRHSGYRLDDAAGEARRVAGELEATAGDLARIRGRGDCPCDWGVCPEHGNTLRGTGGQSWCEAPGCGRRWNYDRAGLPCTEPVEYDVRDATGAGGPMCAGHAHDARERLVGAVVTPLPAAGNAR
ncbi:MAG TPA: hypothetical protein VJT31_28505 [Rugosimonospora sp.]|nr:hypothetical protein [Rugosimonospora sp.]